MITEGNRWEYEDLSKLRFDKIESHQPPLKGKKKSKSSSHHTNDLPFVYLHSSHVTEIELENKKIEIRI